MLFINQTSSFLANGYINIAVITERRRTPRRAVSWAAPLQVAATVRVRGMAPLASDAPVPVAAAVRVRAYVCPIVVLRAVLPTDRTPVEPAKENVDASVPTIRKI